MTTRSSRSEVIILDVELARGVGTVHNLDASFLVVAHALLKEVCLALERDHIHECEGVLIAVVLWDTELEEQPIGDEPDVLIH